MSAPELKSTDVPDSELTQGVVEALRNAGLPNPTRTVYLQADQAFYTAAQDGDPRTYEQIVVEAVRASQNVNAGARVVGEKMQVVIQP